MQNQYFLYTRKSTDVEDKQVMSIEAQLNELRALAVKDGLSVTQEFVEKQSAKAPGRPIFNELLARIEKGEAQGIICWKLDRLARNPVDGGQISWFLQKGIIQHIQTPERSYRPNDNVMLMAVELGMANQFILDLSSNTKRGLREKVRRGEFPGLAPIGYLHITVGQTKSILVDKQTAPVIKAAFELYAQGNSRLEDIAKFLFDRGIITRKTKHKGVRGSLPVSKMRISFMLDNPFYCGLFRYAGELHQGKHQAIITKQLFDKVQEVAKVRNRPQKAHKEPQALCGLFRCGNCPMMVTAENRTKIQKNGNTHHYIYYRCTRKSKTIKCLEKPVRSEEIEKQLFELFKPFILPKEWAEQLLSMADKSEQDSAHAISAVVQDLHSKTEDINRKQERLFQGYLSEDIDPERYRQEKNKLTLEKKTLTEQITKLQHKQKVWVEPLKSFIKDAEKLGEITLSPELHPKKSAAQKIFGLNLFLQNQKIESVPQTQWAAVAAAHSKVGKFPLSKILVGTRGFEPPRDCSH